MNYAKMVKYDTTNWDGINAAIFVSGCKFNCLGCFNTEAQSFNYGEPLTDKVLTDFIIHCRDPKINGINILGGDLFWQDQTEAFDFLFRLYTEVRKPIRVWTGFTYGDICQDKTKKQLLAMIDVLIDGRFEIEKKDLNLLYRGSYNQRVIDVQESLRLGGLVTIL